MTVTLAHLPLISSAVPALHHNGPITNGRTNTKPRLFTTLTKHPLPGQYFIKVPPCLPTVAHFQPPWPWRQMSCSPSGAVRAANSVVGLDQSRINISPRQTPVTKLASGNLKTEPINSKHFQRGAMLKNNHCLALGLFFP